MKIGNMTDKEAEIMIETHSSKGKIWFLISTILIVILSVLDNFFTYMGSADLSLETNPLVYSLGFNWCGLIISNVILIFIFIILVYYSFVKFKPEIIPCHDFKEYCSMIFFNRPDKFIWTLYKFPKNKRAYSYLFACIGYVCSMLIPIIRLRAVLEWILLLSNKKLFYFYCELIENISFNTLFGRFDNILMVVFIVIVLLIFWFFKEYSINKKALNTE